MTDPDDPSTWIKPEPDSPAKKKRPRRPASREHRRIEAAPTAVAAPPAVAAPTGVAAPPAVAAPTAADDPLLDEVVAPPATEPKPAVTPAVPPGPDVAAQGPAATPLAIMRPPDLAPLPVPAPAAEPALIAPEVPALERWYDQLKLSVLADVYANVNYNFPQPQTGKNFGRTMEVTNGFALAWAGADLQYSGEQVGGLVSLRFGPGAAAYAGPDNGSFLQNVKQGYAYWKPKSLKQKLSLEFGKYDSPFGLEVGDSYLNMHYTRPVLYNLGQPFFHTGFRVKASFTEKIGINLFAVNGWNNSVDNNAGKSFGAQLALTPHKKVGIYLGYLGGPENGEQVTITCAADAAYDSNSGRCAAAPGAEGETVTVEQRKENRVFRHMVDLVTTVAVTEKFTLGVNGDFIYDRVIVNPVSGASRRAVWLGGFLSARYAFTTKWAIAARGEYFHDLDGYLTATGRSTMIATGTSTIEFAPTPYLVLRLENRIDGSNRLLYAQGVNEVTRTMGTTTLGIVIRSP